MRQARLNRARALIIEWILPNGVFQMEMAEMMGPAFGKKAGILPKGRISVALAEIAAFMTGSDKWILPRGLFQQEMAELTGPAFASAIEILPEGYG